MSELFEMRKDWDHVKSELRKRFPSLTNEDLHYERGKEEELVGRIQRRLGGEKREKVIHLIKTL